MVNDYYNEYIKFYLHSDLSRENIYFVKIMLVFNFIL